MIPNSLGRDRAHLQHDLALVESFARRPIDIADRRVVGEARQDDVRGRGRLARARGDVGVVRSGDGVALAAISVPRDDVEVGSVSTDSRDAPAGSLFVALAGERADGHRYLDDAFAAGAAAAIVSELVETDGPVIRVASTSEALLRLAADERRSMDPTVVGITGANGKTSTKDLAAAVLGVRLRTHASPGSFNNEIGLPLTILGADPDVEAVVVEMGARRLGDVKLLSGIARPRVATRPSRASREKRLDSKRRQGQRKRERQRPRGDE